MQGTAAKDLRLSGEAEVEADMVLRSMMLELHFRLGGLLIIGDPWCPYWKSD